MMEEKTIILGDRGYISIYSITYRAAKHWLDKQDSNPLASSNSRPVIS